MKPMTWQILIAHADEEEHLAELLAVPLREAGYIVAHSGTVLVGESVIGEASKVLNLGGPVVLCGTVKALGTGLVHRIVNAAQRYNGVRIFPVQMEQDAYLDSLTIGPAITRYWQDPTDSIQELINALQKHYPLPPKAPTNPMNPDAATTYQEAHKQFLEQQARVEKRIREGQGR